MRNRLLTITFTIACLIAIVVLVRQANIRPSGTRHHFATAENGQPLHRLRWTTLGMGRRQIQKQGNSHPGQSRRQRHDGFRR